MTPRIRLVLVPALVSGVALTLFATGPAAASSYQVDRFDDATVNACILDANDCALRGAIIKANAHPGDDIVRLRTGNYTLSISGPDEDQCQTGDLDVRDTLLLEGDGPDRTVIDAAGIDRVLHVVAAGARLVVRGVTITGGNAAASFGGGVYLPEGALRLENCVVSYNESHYGAAIYDEAANTTDGVQIVDTWITGNTTSAGIASALYSDSLLLLERSTISGNSGGYSVKINGDDSTLRNSTISGNSNAAFDAGVNFLATGVTITSCTLADNAGGEILGSTYSISLKNTIVAGDCSLAAVTSTRRQPREPGSHMQPWGVRPGRRARAHADRPRLVRRADPGPPSPAGQPGDRPVHRHRRLLVRGPAQSVPAARRRRQLRGGVRHRRGRARRRR